MLYRLATTDSAGIGLLDETLFGVPLGHHLADGLAGAAGPVTAGLFVLLTALAWRLSRRARRALAPADGTTTPGTVALTRLAPLLPYGTLLIAALAPLGAGLYLLTTTAWTALEHAVLRRGGAAAP